MAHDSHGPAPWCGASDLYCWPGAITLVWGQWPSLLAIKGHHFGVGPATFIAGQEPSPWCGASDLHCWPSRAITLVWGQWPLLLALKGHHFGVRPVTFIAGHQGKGHHLGVGPVTFIAGQEPSLWCGASNLHCQPSPWCGASNLHCWPGAITLVWGQWPPLVVKDHCLGVGSADKLFWNLKVSTPAVSHRNIRD